jgi:hypothetical protein
MSRHGRLLHYDVQEICTGVGTPAGWGSLAGVLICDIAARTHARLGCRAQVSINGIEDE